jgi:zona occludens toxin (predicted ATPase)
MYNNLNSSQLSEEIIRTLSETQTTNELWKISAKVYVDILALNNTTFNDGYVEILWERYRIKKVDTDAYNVWTNSFVRYWTLYSIETWESTGSVSLILTNGALVEWTIRINKDSYYLAKDSATTTYYNLTQR